METFTRALKKYPQVLLGLLVYAIPITLIWTVLSAGLFFLLTPHILQGTLVDIFILPFIIGVVVTITSVPFIIISTPLAFRVLKFAASEETTLKHLFFDHMGVIRSGLIAGCISAVVLLLSTIFFSLMLLGVVFTPEKEILYWSTLAISALITVAVNGAVLLINLSLAFGEGSNHERIRKGMQLIRTVKLPIASGVLLSALLALMFLGFPITLALAFVFFPLVVSFVSWLGNDLVAKHNG